MVMMTVVVKSDAFVTRSTKPQRSKCAVVLQFIGHPTVLQVGRVTSAALVAICLPLQPKVLQALLLASGSRHSAGQVRFKHGWRNGAVTVTASGLDECAFAR